MDNLFFLTIFLLIMITDSKPHSLTLKCTGVRSRILNETQVTKSSGEKVCLYQGQLYFKYYVGNTYLDCCDVWRMCHIGFKKLLHRTRRVENWEQKACFVWKGQRFSPLLSLFIIGCFHSYYGEYTGFAIKPVRFKSNSCSQPPWEFWNNLYLSFILLICKMELK